MISIHAPRTGSDLKKQSKRATIRNFNPRSPHGERRQPRKPMHRVCRFQSTLPARGATLPCLPVSAFLSDFNPRSPHGERRLQGLRTAFARNFNPRSPHGERLISTSASYSIVAFQSTLPARGATALLDFYAAKGAISIHAPRTGSDALRRASSARSRSFQSTLPARGATRRNNHEGTERTISIHAPRTGSDLYDPNSLEKQIHFNPRSPHGERRDNMAIIAIIL